MAEVVISLDDVSDPQVVALLEGHVAQMREVSPPESVHALDVEALRAAEITFWAARDGDEVVGCVALKRLDEDHVELKSMRTLPSRLRQGIAGQLLRHAVNEARQAGYKQVSLETGSEDFFEPARTLYARYGFLPTGPFAGYTDDPNSSYFTLRL
ncbi:GNAT family N-acetyltransferase [Kineosporia rhizophila]|nr:GNAT family N-acetyltransferase [Kineosporia sp. NBRC 101677]MCE0539570.1 GNAT family N-acetyltransferase [Kineosporia rhizophila]